MYVLSPSLQAFSQSLKRARIQSGASGKLQLPRKDLTKMKKWAWNGGGDPFMSGWRKPPDKHRAPELRNLTPRVCSRVGPPKCPQERPRGCPRECPRTFTSLFLPVEDSPRKAPQSVPRGCPRKCPRKCPQQRSVFTCPVFTCSTPQRLDIFENPYGAPRPTESENPPATKKENPKNPKTRLSPKVDARSPKVDARSPKVDARFF